MSKITDALDVIESEASLDTWATEMITKNGKYNQEQALHQLPRTDNRAAQVIAEKLRPYLSYNALTKTWYAWNGQIHMPCEGEGLVFELLKKYHTVISQALSAVEESMRAEAKGSEDSKTALGIVTSTLSKYKIKRDQLGNHTGMSKLLDSLSSSLTVDSDHFLDDRRWFVVQNGVFDMEDVQKTRKFTLLPHDAKRPVYRIWELTDEPGSDQGHWKTFLATSIEDKSQYDVFQTVLSTALMGAVTPDTRSLVSLQGQPRSGKSLILRTVQKFAGKNSFVAAPDSQAIIKNAPSALNARAPMKDARYVAFTEITKQLEREFVLQYTGMDECKSGQKYEATVYWYPQGIIFLASNHGVGMDKTDAALFDRLKIINFPHSFRTADHPAYDGEHLVDPQLEAKILSQGPGFLEWLKEGYLAALDNDFEVISSASMDRIKLDEVDDENTAIQYVNELRNDGKLIYNLDLSASNSVKLNILHADYVSWCKSHSVQNYEVLNQTNLRKTLEKDYSVKNSAGWKVVGLQFTTANVGPHIS